MCLKTLSKTPDHSRKSPVVPILFRAMNTCQWFVYPPRSRPTGNFHKLRCSTRVERNDSHLLALGKELMWNAVPDDKPLLFNRMASGTEWNHGPLDAADIGSPAPVENDHVLDAIGMVVASGRYIALQEKDPARLDRRRQHDVDALQS